MPSRKQRRRREKLQRHEYEWVVETEEGEEVPVERPANGDKRDGKAPASAAPRDRRGREVPKPSMGRVLRRTAIFAPLILVVVFWMDRNSDSTTGAKIYTAVMLLAFFIPFSYLVDVFMYRMLQRRQQRAHTGRN
jgi:hypothetical protein